MPLTYLVSPTFAVPIQSSAKYVNRWQVMGKELYIDKNCTAQVNQSPVQIAHGATAYRMTSDQDAFAQFLHDWMSQALVLYRGFPGCHFCWPDLLIGELRSEGNVDYPEFTMNQNGRGTTRGLPTADLNTAQGVSVQCVDAFTRELSLYEPIPIGFTVAIDAGSAKDLPLCWLNAGEIVVQGPLRSGQYRMHSITWLDVGLPFFRPWPVGFTNLFLPPQRPYLPGLPTLIPRWWDSDGCRFWMDEVANRDAVIGATAVRRARAAQLRGARNAVLNVIRH